MEKKIVIPGEFLSDDSKRAYEGTYVEDGKVYSSLFGVASLTNHIKVVPLSSKFIPKPRDIVIGVIKEITFFNWIVDIRSPYEGLLHISEFPKRIDNPEMSKYLNVGDSIIALVKDVDSSMKVELTLNDQRLRKIKEGRVIEVTPSRVPRLIGRSGSMIALLKNETNCSIFIGQNGRIWITGKDKNMDLAVKTILKIERETHISGLTDRVTRFLKKEKGEKIEEREKESDVEEEREELVEGEKESDVEEERGELVEGDRECEGEEEKPGGILDELLDEKK